MYTKRRFPLSKMIIWTKNELIFFVVLSSLVTVLYQYLGLKWLQLPLTPIGLIGTAVAFMISFQNNAAYGRIWEARKIWGGIVNTSRTLIITVKDSFYVNNPSESKDESSEIKIITNRHIAWLTALRYAMRTKKPWEATYKNKHNDLFFWITPEFNSEIEDELKPLLSESEYQRVMSAKHKPNEIISLQSAHFKSLTDENKIWNFTLLKLQSLLEELTALQGKSERIKNFPYPKQYGSLGYHLVHIFIWLLPFAIIPTFSKMGAELSAHDAAIGNYFVWLNIPLTVIVIWVFNTMLRIGLAGENPFEGSPNDVPISNISRGISRDILQIIGTPEKDLPPPFENVNDIEM